MAPKIKERYKLNGYNELELSDGRFGHRGGWLVVYEGGTRAWISDGEMGAIVAAENAKKTTAKPKATRASTKKVTDASQEDDAG